MKKNKLNKLIFIFPIVVFILCCLNIYSQVSNINIAYTQNIISILISFIGIIGSVFYYFKIKIYTKFIYIWSVSQAIIITRYFPDVRFDYIEKPIWNATQIFKVTVEFSLLFKPIYYVIKFNFISIIYIGVAHILYLNPLIGSQIKIRPYKKDSFLNSLLPAIATIEKRITLSKEKNWLLIKLNEKNSDGIEYALIKPKDDGILKIKKRNQMIYFLLVPNLFLLEEDNKKENFKTGDWAILG